MEKFESSEVNSVLITGGTGFLGLHACNYFSRQGIDVTAFDLHPFQEGDEVENVEFIQGDVRDSNHIREVVSDVDAVIHAASAIPTWDDEEIHEATVEGTRNVLKAAEDAEVERVIYLSSAAVYGRRDDPPVTEESPLQPRSVYGRAKLDAEAVCREFRDRGVCVPIVRPQALIGHQRLGVFQILFDWVHSGANVPLVGSGDNKYQLLHVNDLVSALELLLSAEKQAVNTEFNAGAVEFGSMREDFQALIDHAGTGKRVIGLPAFVPIWGLRLLTYLNMSPLYPSLYETANEDTYLSVEKLRELGWEPEYSNKKALIDTYEWYRENFTRETSEGEVGNRVAPDQKGLRVVKKVFQVI